jgi:hypothetical protein
MARGSPAIHATSPADATLTGPALPPWHGSTPQGVLLAGAIVEQLSGQSLRDFQV